MSLMTLIKFKENHDCSHYNDGKMKAFSILSECVTMIKILNCCWVIKITDTNIFTHTVNSRTKLMLGEQIKKSQSTYDTILVQKIKIAEVVTRLCNRDQY